MGKEIEFTKEQWNYIMAHKDYVPFAEMARYLGVSHGSTVRKKLDLLGIPYDNNSCMSFQEIADELGISHTMTRKAYKEGIQKMRDAGIKAGLYRDSLE
jgi:predicted ArsR family transcriptional regulator